MRNRSQSLPTLNKKQNHNWSNFIKPIKNYNKNSSMFGYPLDFIFFLQHIITQGYQLYLNLPQTLSGTYDNYLKTNFNNKKSIIGKICFQHNVIKSYFDNSIQKNNQILIQKLRKRDTLFSKYFPQNNINQNILQLSLPFIVIKTKQINHQGQIQLHTVILNKQQYRKIFSLDVNQIAQSFIYPNSHRISFSRFFYYPYKEINSIAYKIDNNKHYLQKKIEINLWTIQENQQNKFTFVKVMYSNKSYYQQTINLVKVIENKTRNKIQKIVCDWIYNSQNKYYLSQVRQVKFQTCHQLKQMGSLNDVLNFISCSMCCLKFQPKLITKIVSYKLIWQFFQHCLKRCIKLSFKPLLRYSTDKAKVCDLCYILIVSECNLMQMEKIMNLMTHPRSLQLPSTSEHQNYFSEQQYKCNNLKLMVWRLFIYIEDLKEIRSLFKQEGNYYLMIKFNQWITSFKLDISKAYNDTINVKGIKIHYFFSEDNNLHQFLSSISITAKITTQENWNSSIAEGNTSHVYEYSQGIFTRKFKQILLFFSKTQYCVLQMHIGLKNEGYFDTSNVLLKQSKGLFIPESKFTICSSIPTIWMQIIDPTYFIKDIDQNTNNKNNINKSKRSIIPILPINKILKL